MGRRKRRRDSDVDLTVEEMYDRSRAVAEQLVGGKRNDHERTLAGGYSDDATASCPTDGGVVPSLSVVTNNPSKLEEEHDKIDALRRKKQARKDRQQEKKAIKLQEANEKKEALLKQQEQAKKRKKEETKTTTDKSQAASSLFQTLRKGVQYQDVIVGKGPMVQDRKKVRVAYVLRAKQRYGKILDSSNDFGFRLGRGEVIEGWDIGVQGMRLGGKRYLIIPPEAGYGNKNVGGGPGATLFFEVTVVAC